MPETLKIILVLLAAIAAILLTLRWVVWKMKKAGEFIIRDLKQKRAFDPQTAVTLPYAENRMLRIGLRDYRPQVLANLVQHGIVHLVEGGKYYLREGQEPGGGGTPPAG